MSSSRARFRAGERRGGGRALAALAPAFVVLCISQLASAFPGVVVTKAGDEQGLRSATVVLMRHGGVSVLTLSAEYEGPLAPFALLLPVPSDVRARAVKTVKRTVLSRVEALTAPRFHAFYEQDPCDEAPVDQGFDEHVKAKGAGFLAPPGLPPLDRHYAVSNEISVPMTAAFKERESEFTYRDLVYTEPDKLRASLDAAGYRIAERALAALAGELTRGAHLLLAEVSLAHVELAAGGSIQLGGIRFSTREPMLELAEALGGANGHAEDLFVYVFDRGARYELTTNDAARLPLAVRVEARVAERLGTAYNGLFDAFSARHPDAYATEFAWSTSGCGEPCPDVPLRPDELLTLGGDVMEAQTTTARERSPEPSEEPTLERERFETHLAELAPKERPQAEREHAAERRELERRRALTARQTYVLTRLHHRYPAGAPRRNLELAPAGPLTGGVAIPVGARGEVTLGAAPAPENRLQVRFFALEPWARGSACASPRRFRWGKRWASEARAPRAVALALDLASQSRDPNVLGKGLLVALPELGLAAAELEPATPPVAAPPGSSAASAAKPRGCALGAPATGNSVVSLLLAACAGSLAVRRRSR